MCLPLYTFTPISANKAATYVTKELASAPPPKRPKGIAFESAMYTSVQIAANMKQTKKKTSEM